MVGCFNGRVQREVLGITAYSHDDLETLLTGLSVAYNGRRQRALNGLSPEMVLRQCLRNKPALANPTSTSSDSTAIRRALEVAAAASEISQPDTAGLPASCWRR